MNNIREIKKQQFLKQILQDHLSEERVINVYIGKLKIIPYKFKNPFNYGCTFTLRVQDPDEHIVEQEELQLISDGAEWQYFCKENPPVDWQMITRKEKEYIFYLNAHESVELLFKFLTYRYLA